MVKDDLTIGLYGIAGVYNYGCEAIVRGTETILRENWPDVHIKYASLRPKDDKRRLKGCNVEIIPREKYPILSLPGISKTLAHTIGMPFYPYYEENIDWIDNCDAVLSIGGDLYTLPSKYHDNSRFYFLKYLRNPYHVPINYGNKLFGNAYNPLIHFGDIVKEKQKKFVIWGASIGPFEQSENAKKIFRNHLLKVDLITSREPVTKSYLNSLGIYKNVENCSDPAFLVSSNKNIEFKTTSDELVIGINLSPLSIDQVFGEDPDRIIIKQVEIIKKIAKNFEAKIILIPHVISDSILDDDLRYLKLLKDSIDDNTINIKLIDEDPGFLGIKETISKCDLMIAARMHCAVNALEACVPTIFVSYSKKTEGMANYIYKNNRWIISLENMEEDTVLKLIKSMISEKGDLKVFLENRMKNIRLNAYQPLSQLNQILKI